MTSHRTISLKTALLVVLLTLAVPCSALASPLLGGYGGPGEGNQAILGSALVGGAGGGGGSSSSGGSGGSNGATGSTGSSPSGAAGAGTSGDAGEVISTGPSGHSASPGEGGRAAGRGAASRAAHRKASGSAPRAYPASSRYDASQTASVGSQALGLSLADLGYVLLALGALGATAVLTRRLARAPSVGDGL